MSNLAEQNAGYVTEEPEKSYNISLKIARILYRTDEHKVTLLQEGFLSLVKNSKQNLQYILQANALSFLHVIRIDWRWTIYYWQKCVPFLLLLCPSTQWSCCSQSDNINLIWNITDTVKHWPSPTSVPYLLLLKLFHFKWDVHQSKWKNWQAEYLKSN